MYARTCTGAASATVPARTGVEVGVHQIDWPPWVSTWKPSDETDSEGAVLSIEKPRMAVAAFSERSIAVATMTSAPSARSVVSIVVRAIELAGSPSVSAKGAAKPATGLGSVSSMAMARTAKLPRT
jgi:hypothetical protein